MIFRPSAQALVWIRVDELAETARFDRAVGAQGPGSIAGGFATPPATATAEQLADPARALDGIVESRRQLEENRRDGVIPEQQYHLALRNLEAQRELVLLEQSQPRVQPRPWALLGASPDRRFGRFAIQPQAVEIQKNGYRMADTATMKVDWRTLPFDPRIVRAAAIEVVVGVVSEDDFARGMRGERDPQTGLPLSVIRQTPGAPTTPSSATRFCGWVDEWGVAYGDGDITEVQCRDFTALFLDAPLDPAATMNLDLPIDESVRALLAQYPTLADFPVRYVADPEQPSGAPAPSLGSSIPTTNRPRRGRRAQRARSGDQRMNLWDHITDNCVALGLVPVVRGYELQIVQPVTQYRTTNVRRMIYGRNIEKVDFSRKLGGVKVPTIEVRAYDPAIGRVRWARWPSRDEGGRVGIVGLDAPPRPLRANELTPSGLRVDERVQTFTLKPSTSPQAMMTAARSIFEQIGRQEVEGTLETRDVSSWDIQADQPKDAQLADLLTMDAGDALEILVAAPDRARPESSGTTTPGDWIGMERQARARYLVGLGMPADVAQNIAALQDAVASMLFRVSEATIRYDTDEGVRISVSFANFLEARELRSQADRRLSAFLRASPDQQAVIAAEAAAGFDALIDSVIASSEDRGAAFEAAAASVTADGVPAAPDASEVERLQRLTEDEIFTNTIGRD